MVISVRMVDSAHGLGVIVDSHLTMTTDVSAECRVDYYQLGQFASVDTFVVVSCHQVARLLISARLDYCNLLL